MKVIVDWLASCGGCDVSILDLGVKILDVVKEFEIIYWPVALDFKKEDLKSSEADVAVVNGAVRTSEQEEQLKLIREKVDVLIAYGSCACFGGIPGLGNLFKSEEILKTAYVETPSTTEGKIPQEVTKVDGFELTLPKFLEDVKALDDVVDVDYYVPGCPPSISTIEEMVELMLKLKKGERPEKKVLASDKSLCYECPRSKSFLRPPTINRPHEVVADEERCLLEQGIICLGFVTRGGCGARCVRVNMPCRGCYGKVPNAFDFGTEAITAIAMAGTGEDYLPPIRITEAVDRIKDVVGLLYQFCLPKSKLGDLK